MLIVREIAVAQERVTQFATRYVQMTLIRVSFFVYANALIIIS